MAERAEYFIVALRGVVKKISKNERKKYKDNLAKNAGISRYYLNDIAMGRRPGNEDVRCLISKLLGFHEYEDMILLGKYLLEGVSFGTAQQMIAERQNLRIKPDGVIEEILKTWDFLSVQEKEEVLQLVHFQKFKRSTDPVK